MNFYEQLNKILEDVDSQRLSTKDALRDIIDLLELYDAMPENPG